MPVANTTELRGLIEERLGRVTPSGYIYPLGYTTWGVDEVMAALDCLCAQETSMWTRTAAFEYQFADYLSSNEAVMVNSGSSADLVMMLAARETGLLQPGDEILIPAVTWPTQVWSAVLAGFNVRLVDVDPETLNVSVATLEAALTPKTKALFLVHLMGNPCDMHAIGALCDRRGLVLFEDCCEALGASFDGQQVGTFGLASAFSFFASHHLSTMEGGMIATDSPDFADACRQMRAHGWARDLKHRKPHVSADDDPRFLFLGMGFNFRPTELQAAFGLIQLQKLETLNAHRKDNASIVSGRFRDGHAHIVTPLRETSAWAAPAWFALPFVLREGLPYSRKQVMAYLQDNGVDTRPIVGGNLMRHPAFWKYREMAPTSLAGADVIHDRGFYLGLPPDDRSMDGLIELLNRMDTALR